MIRRATLIFGLLAALTTTTWSLEEPQRKLPRVALTAGMHLIQAQVAATPEQRATGLMYRTDMPANEGMLFVFEEPAGQCVYCTVGTATLPHSMPVLAPHSMKWMRDTDGRRIKSSMV